MIVQIIFSLITYIIFLLSVDQSKILKEVCEEDFRCRGNPSINKEMIWNNVLYEDCQGGCLPNCGINTELIELMNELQKKFSRQVVINSGFRCPVHNAYIAAELYNWVDPEGRSGNPFEVSSRSKHMMGAAADFYIKGYENDPYPIIDSILSIEGLNAERRELYSQNVRQRNREGIFIDNYYYYRAYVTPRWWIHPYAENEGRDIDNRGYEGVYFHIHRRTSFSLEGCQPVR